MYFKIEVVGCYRQAKGVQSTPKSRDFVKDILQKTTFQTIRISDLVKTTSGPLLARAEPPNDAHGRIARGSINHDFRLPRALALRGASCGLGPSSNPVQGVFLIYFCQIWEFVFINFEPIVN